MAIPEYHKLMFPLLKLVSDGKVYSIRECIDILSKELVLTPEEKSELLPSRGETIFYNRVGWARTYLKKAGLIESPKRIGFYQTK
jgi:restriction system protein